MAPSRGKIPMRSVKPLKGGETSDSEAAASSPDPLDIIEEKSTHHGSNGSEDEDDQPVQATPRLGKRSETRDSRTSASPHTTYSRPEVEVVINRKPSMTPSGRGRGGTLSNSNRGSVKSGSGSGSGSASRSVSPVKPAHRSRGSVGGSESSRTGGSVDIGRPAKIKQREAVKEEITEGETDEVEDEWASLRMSEPRKKRRIVLSDEDSPEIPPVRLPSLNTPLAGPSASPPRPKPVVREEEAKDTSIDEPERRETESGIIAGLVEDESMAVSVGDPIKVELPGQEMMVDIPPGPPIPQEVEELHDGDAPMAEHAARHASDQDPHTTPRPNQTVTASEDFPPELEEPKAKIDKSVGLDTAKLPGPIDAAEAPDSVDLATAIAPHSTQAIVNDALLSPPPAVPISDDPLERNALHGEGNGVPLPDTELSGMETSGTALSEADIDPTKVTNELDVRGVDDDKMDIETNHQADEQKSVEETIIAVIASQTDENRPLVRTSTATSVVDPPLDSDTRLQITEGENAATSTISEGSSKIATEVQEPGLPMNTSELVDLPSDAALLAHEGTINSVVPDEVELAEQETKADMDIEISTGDAQIPDLEAGQVEGELAQSGQSRELEMAPTSAPTVGNMEGTQKTKGEGADSAPVSNTAIISTEVTMADQVSIVKEGTSVGGSSTVLEAAAEPSEQVIENAGLGAVQAETPQAVEAQRSVVSSSRAPSAVPHIDEEGEEEIDEDAVQAESEPEVDEGVEMELDRASSATPAISAVPTAEAKTTPKAKAKKGGKDTVKKAGKGKSEVKPKKEKASKTKGKTKLSDIKASEAQAARATSESVHPASASVASLEIPNESQDDNIVCVCGIRYSDDEENTWIGCESCDKWYHPQCMGLTEDQIPQLDVYICKFCERTTKQYTIWKKVCKRETCGRALLTSNSKFCSDLCAYQHFKTFAATVTNKKTLNHLASSFITYPRPADVQVTHHTAKSQAGGQVAVPQFLLAKIKHQLGEIEASLELVKKRQAILQKAIERSEALSPVTVTVNQEAEAASKSRKKKKGGGGGGASGGEDKQCGWDKRLIWDDEQVMVWRNEADANDNKDHDAEAEVVEEIQICSLPKRRCDRHGGWQRTIGVSLEVEQGGLERRHELLSLQKEQLERSLEDDRASQKVRDVLREKLGAKGIGTA